MSPPLVMPDRGLLTRPHSSGSRRMRQEAALVKKRNAEYRQQEMWKNTNQYFHVWDMKSAKYSAWCSPESYNESMEAHKKILQAEEKERQLEDRRKRLRHLLMDDMKQYEVELKAMKCRRSQTLYPEDLLKMANLELKRKEEEARKRESELKLYHHWRNNNPRIREIESLQRNMFVKKAWIDQVLERKQEREKELKEKEEYERQLRLEVVEDERREKEELEERRTNALKLQELLEEQVKLLREKELKAEELKREEAVVLQQQAELEEAFEQRKAVEEKRRNKELGLFWTRQYQLKLKQRLNEVKRDLQEDQQIIDDLLRMEEAFQDKLRAKKERAKQEMLYMKYLLQKQMELEKQRERDIEFLFHEEAKRMWKQEEHRWQKEQEARDKLMREVLTTIKEQVEENLLRNQEEQEELLSTREELLKRLEEANEELKQERAALERSKLHRHLEIDQQVEEKRRRKEDDLRLEEVRLEEEREAEKREEEKLLEELKRMNLTSYAPTNYGRRRLLW